MNEWQLHHGDCADILPDLGVKADLILTSPPYDNLRTYGGHGFDFDRVADACVGALADGGVIVWIVADATVDGSETGTSFRQALGFMERGLKLHDTMIYQKITGNPTKHNPRYKSSFEYMFVLGSPATFNPIADIPTRYPGKATHTRRKVDGSLSALISYEVPDLRVRDNVWAYDPGFNKCHPGYPDAHKHPATFPTALAKDHILTWTNPGDVVLDPMAGSGTVLRAAVDLARQAIGVEIHEPYLDIIRNRMAQLVLV